MTRKQARSISSRKWIACSALLPLLALTGCQDAPSFSIAGSFFPDWIFCSLMGIVVALASYRALVALKLESYVQPAVLVYPSIALSFSVTLWLVFFG
jgi:YtcA family